MKIPAIGGRTYSTVGTRRRRCRSVARPTQRLQSQHAASVAPVPRERLARRTRRRTIVTSGRPGAPGGILTRESWPSRAAETCQEPRAMLYASEHPLVRLKVAELRDAQTRPPRFRELVREIS